MSWDGVKKSLGFILGSATNRIIFSLLSCSYCLIELINDERMSSEGVGVEANI